jgi:hypothetical protein
MLGRKERRQPELFVAGSLRELLPDEHVLVRVDRVLDLTWLADEVADLYDLAGGRPSIDPEVTARLIRRGWRTTRWSGRGTGGNGGCGRTPRIP